MKSNDHIHAEMKGASLWLTLVNDKKRNPISESVIDGLVKSLEWAAENDKVKVVVIASRGSVFSAGGDIKAMKERRGMFSGDCLELKKRYKFGIQQIPRAMEAFDKPLVAVVQGAAVGAGADLAFMCDFRIGCEKTSFAESFGKLALVPGDGGSYFLSRIVGYARAMEMSLLGEKIESEEALRIGLLNRLVDSSELEREALSLCKELESRPVETLQMIKRGLKSLTGARLDDHLDLMSAYQAITQRSQSHQEIMDRL